MNPRAWNEAGNIYYDTNAYEEAIASYRKAIELDPTDATFQTNLAKAELALGLARTRDETPNPENTPGAVHGNLPQVEPGMAKKAPSGSIEADPRRENGVIPKELSTQPDRTAEPETEAPYWVFKTDPPLENALQPVKQYSTLGAGTAANTVKSLPAYTKQPYNQPAFQHGQVLPGANANASALMVQLTPRAARPVGTDHPAPQAAAPGDQAAGQAPIDLNVLEDDITRYRRVTEMNPNNDRAWDALGNMYEAAGLHSEAIAAFKQAITLGPRKEAYHYHLAIALAYQMHYDEAIQALQDVIALNPNYVLAHCALASCYRRLGKEAEAQEHIAIASPSMEYEKEYNRACFKSIRGNTDLAFALLETALEKEQVQTAMLRSDPDLDFIRSDPRFVALLEKLESASPAV